MVRRRFSLPFIDVKEDDEVIADEEINKRKWKSYHEIDVKQNMGNGRYIHKIIIMPKYANLFWITMVPGRGCSYRTGYSFLDVWVRNASLAAKLPWLELGDLLYEPSGVQYKRYAE